jgi:hypothetical protein
MILGSSFMIYFHVFILFVTGGPFVKDLNFSSPLFTLGECCGLLFEVC